MTDDLRGNYPKIISAPNEWFQISQRQWFAMVIRSEILNIKSQHGDTIGLLS